MEVHTHTHPSTGSGHRKKWTHYFWEFLMLFLAVFCGFLAENQREHMVEHQREKEFIRSLIVDIQNDAKLIQSYFDSELSNEFNYKPVSKKVNEIGLTDL